MAVRPAGQGDIEAIALIERCSPSPWSIRLIHEELQCAHGVAMVSGSPITGGIIGWCCVRLLAPEAELLKIAIHPNHRNQGHGKSLLQEALRLATEAKCTTFFLEVRARNAVARRLYQNCGFQILGRRKRYYKHPEDDCILYQMPLKSPEHR